MKRVYFWHFSLCQWRYAARQLRFFPFYTSRHPQNGPRAWPRLSIRWDTCLHAAHNTMNVPGTADQRRTP